jgi:hypothetical protein
MSKAFTGGCACGAIRYRISAEPVFMNHCQCHDCQHATGAGHGSYLSFPGRKAVTQTGKTSQWDVVVDSGNVKTHNFCPTCGSPVYLTYSMMPDIITIHAASLDEPGRFKPQMVTYHVRAHAWDHLDPDVPTVERMPPS